MSTTDTTQAPPRSKIVEILGYDGLPKRFLVESQYGFLNTESFGSLQRAYIFQSKSKAINALKQLYPDSIIIS